MSLGSKLAILREMLESSEASLRSAKQIINELAHETGSSKKYEKIVDALPKSDFSDTSEDTIMEGVFDGQSMFGTDKKTYPVPANYASKSKLIPGDVLKLTIKKDGSFLYKQIGPIERKHVTGPLIHEDDQYKVLANGKAYKVLLASVTYFRAEIGDNVVLVIPEFDDSEWGAIENIIPKNEMEEE